MPEITARWTGLTCPQCGAPTATTAPAEVPAGRLPIPPPPAPSAPAHPAPPWAARGDPSWIEWCTGTCLRLAIELTPALGDPPEPSTEPPTAEKE